MDIAVLGLGRMGHALAQRLLDEGHHVVVWNRSPGRAGDLVGAGAREAQSIADAAGAAEVAVTILADDDAVQHVALGDSGVRAALPDGALYVDASTVAPTTSDALLEAFGSDRFASMPVLGAPSAVEAGKATYLVGAAPHVVYRLQPMTKSLSEKVLALPSPHVAASAKLASNLVLLSGVVALAEAFAIARAGGMSDDQLRTLLAENPVVSPAVRLRFEGILTGEQDTWWSTALGAKDARLAAELAAAEGVDAPLAFATRDRYRAAAERDPDADIAAITRLYSASRAG